MFGRRAQLGLRKARKDANKEKKAANAKARAAGTDKSVGVLRRGRSRRLKKSASKKAREETEEYEQSKEDDGVPPESTGDDDDDDEHDEDDPMGEEPAVPKRAPKAKAKSKAKAKAKALPKSKAKAKAKATHADEDESEPSESKSKGPKGNKKSKGAADSKRESPLKKGKATKASCSYVADILAKGDPEDYEYMVYFATSYGFDTNAEDLRAELRKELPWYASCTYDVYYSKVRKGVGVFLRELLPDGKKMNLGSFGFAQTAHGFLVSAAAAICLAAQQ